MYRPLVLVLAALLLTGVGCRKTESANQPVQPETDQTQVTSSAPNEPTDWREFLYAWAKTNGVLQGRTGCEQTVRPEGSYKEYILSESTSLFETVCFQAAYQTAYAYFLVTKTDEINVELVDFYREDSPAVTAETIAGFTDFSKGSLKVFTKSRGLGDCGTQASYTLENSRFVLEKMQEKECEELDTKASEINIDPTTWPVTYQRSAVK